EEDQEDDDLI
nr:hypothetical protein [Tanacetum cinerariifolium]